MRILLTPMKKYPGECPAATEQSTDARCAVKSDKTAVDIPSM